MSRLLFFDTETTGLIRRDLPDPHLVQIAWQVYDSNRNMLEEHNYIVKPDGWMIPPLSARIHGIDTQKATDEGTPLLDVWKLFAHSWNEADVIVAHNLAFDEQVVHLAHRDLGSPGSFPVKPGICTMKGAQLISASPFVKWPTLSELHTYFFDVDFENQHDALADIAATARCFWLMVDAGWISF